VSLVFLSACGGSDGESLNDVSEPTIDERFAVDADGRELALLCYGEGSPTVFMEPGDDGTGTDGFSNIMRPIGERATACTYDRPGFGEAIPLPRLAGRWSMRPATYTLSSRPQISQYRSFTWVTLGRIHRALLRVALPRRGGGRHLARHRAGGSQGRSKAHQAHRHDILGTPDPRSQARSAQLRGLRWAVLGSNQ
jgi:hypothetical protein